VGVSEVVRRGQLCRGFLALLTLCAAAVGCGGDAAPPLRPAGGQIHFDDGTPLPEGTELQFWPVSGVVDPAYVVWGEVVSDGELEINTSVAGAGSRAGAPAGTYKVTLSVPGSLDPRPADEYFDKNSTTLTVEIKDAADNTALKLRVQRATGPRPP